MESASLVSKARTAFHSAAAKAEKVFTDIKKSDSTTNPDSASQSPDIVDNTTDLPADATIRSKNNHDSKSSKWKPAPIKAKQDWQERFKKIRIGHRGVEEIEKADISTMAFAIFDDNLYLDNSKRVSHSKVQGSESFPTENLITSNSYIIPSAAVVKQLAIAVEVGKNVKSMKDLMDSSKSSSPVRERASLSFSAMKSLMLRDKEDNFASEFRADEKALSLINSFVDTCAEGHLPGLKSDSGLEASTNLTSLPKEIHGAPPESFIIKLSEAIGSLKTLKKMACYWLRIVAELRRLWSEEQYIPGIPTDEIPELNSCLLYQQLQVINCCISRKRRQAVASESLDSILSWQSLSNTEDSASPEDTIPPRPILYARINTGELVIRLGADKQCDTLTMLETGEPVYAPIMQEAPLLTEDLIKENEEFVLRTGSVGAGCSQLLSDMQAFKAANPGCILEDFVRWHSPPDWTETEISNETVDDIDLPLSRGQLSSRMQKEGNLWRELWETSKPVPAIKQSPLYDEDLAVEGILNALEDIPPSELFEQLFVSLLGSGFVIAENILATNSHLSKLFFECKDYIIAACQGKIWVEKIDDICQVYETVLMMLLSPDEVLSSITKSPHEASTTGDQKGRFKRLNFIFGGKDRQLGKTQHRDQKNSEESSTNHTFSSIFSKKPPKPGTASPADKPVLSSDTGDSDWTVV